MADTDTADGGIELKDRSAGLVAMGIVQIVLGALCGVMVPFMLMATLASAHFEGEAGTTTSPVMMIPGTLFYLAMAVAFIWLGIGSIKARRWARALLLISSWFWLISGSLGLIFMAFLLPNLQEQMTAEGGLPEAMLRATLYLTMGFMAVFYVLLPGMFVIFYGSKHVEATCERKDPTERWTDRCPLPVLAVSAAAAVGAAWAPLMGFYGWAVPFFGSILNGAAGAVIVIIMVALLAYVAYGAYRLDITAWWCAVLMVVLWGLSGYMTFAHGGLMEFYEMMNMPAEQLEAMAEYDILNGPAMVVLTGAWALAILGYLFYIKRYFVQPTENVNS